MSTGTKSRELQLTERDKGLLEALTLRIRLITSELTARLWETSIPYARRRLGRLRQAGLLQAARVSVHPLLPLSDAELRTALGDFLKQMEE